MQSSIALSTVTGAWSFFDGFGPHPSVASSVGLQAQTNLVFYI